MPSHLARLAALSALALSLSACSNGVGGTSLGFSSPPNGSGGGTGLLQAGANGSALLRFVHGAPDIGTVDICIDQASVSGTVSTNIKYKNATLVPLTIPSGIAHTISVYTVPSTGAGTECATAPGPYFGSAAVGTTTILLGASTRSYLVLGGRAGSTLGLYYYPAPTSFVNPPTSPEAQVFNASPTFGAAGFGYSLPPAGPVQNLIPSLNPPVPSKITATVTTAGSFGIAPLPSQPSTFYVGKPVKAGTIVPLASTPAAALITGNTYVADVFSIDSTSASGVDIVSISEQTIGYGF
jgi:hypothetical protein